VVSILLSDPFVAGCLLVCLTGLHDLIHAVLLVPPSTSKTFVIAGRCVDYYEVKPAMGKLDRLRELVADLSSTMPPSDVKRELFRRTQASDAEIDAALQRIGVIDTPQGLHILPANDIVPMTQRLFNVIMANSWSIDDLQLSRCSQMDAQLTAEWVYYLFSMLGHPVTSSTPGSASASSTTTTTTTTTVKSGSSSSSSDGNNVWTLEKSKVGRAAVHIVFQHCPVSPYDCHSDLH
jgi:hypothetical protein